MTARGSAFERRRQNRQTRGLARKRAVLILVAMATGPLLALAIAYRMLAS